MIDEREAATSRHDDGWAITVDRITEAQRAALARVLARRMGEAVRAAGVDLDDEDAARMGRRRREVLTDAGYPAAVIELAAPAAAWAAYVTAGGNLSA